jgi:hypothetical protein
MKCRLFSHLTFKRDLDLGGSNPIIVICPLSRNGDHLCQAKLFQKHFSSLKIMERA